MRGIAVRAAVVVCLVAGCCARAAEAPGAAERAAVAALAKPYVDGGWVRGVVIGLVDVAKGPRVYGFGTLSAKPGAAAPDGKTVFEIASVTKTFTALLLAEMAGRGEVALEDPVARFLPPTVKLPQTDQPITLLRLSTHHSGLPRMPSNFRPANPNDPYADYTEQKLYEFLPAAKVHATADYEYSNIAYGLLGHALSRAGGKPYERLIIDRICAPLGMPDTVIALAPAHRARLAPPFDADLDPDSNWDLGGIPGGGAIRSTADDMLRYVAAHAGLRDDLPPALATAIALTHQDRDAGPSPAVRMGMGWHVAKNGRLFHNGQTGGYHSFVAVDPKLKAGVVVLANTATPRVDTLGSQAMGLLAGNKAAPAAPPVAVTLPPPALERYVGAYALDDGGALAVKRDGARLVVSGQSLPMVRLYPRSETEFFAKATDATATFESGADGKVTGVVIRQAGKDRRATRSR